jgi:hypothetical protein
MMPQDGLEKQWVLVDEEWVNDYTYISGTAPVKIRQPTRWEGQYPVIEKVERRIGEMHVRHQEVPRLIHLIGIETPLRASVRRSNVQLVMRMPITPFLRNRCARKYWFGYTTSCG